MDKTKGVLSQVDLRTGLNLPAGRRQFIIFRDQLSGLEYIRNCYEIARKGLFVQLDAYRANVFTDFQIVQDDETGIWSQLHSHLNGRGVSDIQALHWELPMRSILQPLREIANPGYFHFILSQHPKFVGREAPESLLNEAEHKLSNLINGAADLIDTPLDARVSCNGFRLYISTIYHLEWIYGQLSEDMSPSLKQLIPWLREKTSSDMWLSMFCWVYLDCLRSSLGMQNLRFVEQISSWRFFGIIESALWDMGSQVISPGDISRSIALLLRLNGWLAENKRRSNIGIILNLLTDRFIRDFLKLNDYGGKTWFGKENAEIAFFLMWTEGMMEILTTSRQARKRKLSRMEKLAGQILTFQRAAESSGYDFNRFLEILDQA